MTSNDQFFFTDCEKRKGARPTVRTRPGTRGREGAGRQAHVGPGGRHARVPIRSARAMVAASKERMLLSMRMISPRIGSPRLLPLLRPDEAEEVSPAGSPLPRILPYGRQRGLRETGESRFFDGRVTTPRTFRLETPRRSRRTEAPTGTLPGKDDLGMPLSQRLTLKSLQASPPRTPRYVNDATTGSVKLSCFNIEAPLVCPKRQEFSRLAVAVGRGGTFERSHAGCLPFSP